jgi:hypothetical protein
MKKSRIATPVPHPESSLRHPLVDLLIDTKTELLELALRSGLKVFTTMLEEDRTAICGPRYAHERSRRRQVRAVPPADLLEYIDRRSRAHTCR